VSSGGKGNVRRLPERSRIAGPARAGLATCAALAFGLQQVCAQGTVNFANHGVDWSGNAFASPIYEADGVTPCGANYDAVLLYGDASLALGNPAYVVPNSTTAFSGNGLFSGPTLTISTPSLQFAAFTVVVWNSAYGTSWPAAYYAGANYGFSPIGVLLGGGGSPPGNLELMQSFSIIGPVPEPSSLFLVAAGGVLLASLRRRFFTANP
jgi:hypothetical protein